MARARGGGPFPLFSRRAHRRHGVPMRLLKSTILRGCNVHHGSTVIRLDVDLARLAGRRSGEAGAVFAERFLDRFRELRTRVPESAMSEDFLERDRKSTRLNSSHSQISYAVF